MNRMASKSFVFMIVGLVAMASAVSAGETAADFTLEDTEGNSVSLADFKGKVVVLEWINPDCPFVQRHYEAGTMKGLAERYATKGVVWLAVNSTHYMDAATSEKWRAKYGLAYPILVDRSGEVGRLYDAATTPHMFVIDGSGGVVYEGAIDDDPRGKSESPVDYVARALDELLAGKTVSVSETKPYGCSVKYPK